MFKQKYNLETPLDKIDFVILDLETTGLKPEFRDRVVEFGAVKLRDGKIIDQFTTLINPKRPISPGAYQVNLISHELLSLAPPFRELFYDMSKFLTNSVIVAYNAPFDISFLVKEFELALRSGIAGTGMIDYSAASSGFLMDMPTSALKLYKDVLFPYDIPSITILDEKIFVVDILMLVRRLYPKLDSYKQIAIAKKLAIKILPTHRAYDDVLVATEIFKILVSILKNYNLDKLKYFYDPDLSQKISKLKLERINSAIKQKSEILVKYLNQKIGDMLVYKILPEKLIEEEQLLIALDKNGNQIKNFSINWILEIYDHL